jgi:hypothetical protein
LPAEVIAIDGKTLRRSYQKKGAKAAIHMVSAFAARQHGARTGQSSRQVDSFRLKLKRKLAAWDDDFLATLIAA